jgi:pimeloyl-ACP methyl ester carboxylesterase
VVGHGWGGLVAWTLAVYRPKVVARLAVVSMAHPLRMRAAMITDPLGQGRSSRYAFGFQVPMLPERQLVRDGARKVGQLLEGWSAPGWPDHETAQVYERAMQIPSVAHSALESHRWLARSAVRPDGLQYARHMHTPIQLPTLHLQGALDRCVLPKTARGAGRYVDGPYRWRLIDGAGHFPHEERPEVFDTELRGWLADPEPER